MRRVVGVSPVERSYHIFYMLCDGAPEELRRKLRWVWVWVKARVRVWVNT